MRVAELMKPRVETVSVGESAEVARQRMRQKRIRHLVVTSGRDVVGVVSDRDLEEAGSLRRVQTVGEVMTSPVVTARPETTLRQAANLLRGRAIGCLPVLENGRLVGIVTTTDLLELVGKGAERPVAKSRRFILKGRGPRRKKFSARA